MILHDRIRKSAVFAALVTMTLLPVLSAAQTRVSLPKNKYKVQQDVDLGRKAAQEVEQQFPILNDEQAQAYVSRVGERLVAAIPQQFRQPAFDYEFKVVNASDINAFALPGGPMYVNRGMIEAARNEGEMAGVMAHEISHVALRHATAQATKQGSVGNQLGTIGLILGGMILGGETGAQAGAIVASAWQTKYSRDYETQADVLGSQILADAGYDPRDLANMFQTIARQGSGRSPEWLSSHPDPGNRFEKINREAAQLNVDPNPIKLTREFERVQSRLRELPPARTMAQIQQSGPGRGSTQSPTAGGNYSRSVPFPSARYRAYNGGDISLNVPSNWREFAVQGGLTFAPEGGYGNQGITHGAMIGVYRSGGLGLLNATRNYVNELLQGNSYLSQSRNPVRTTVNGRQAYTATLYGRSPITGRNEVVTVHTVQLRSGDVLTFAAVAPEDEAARYNAAFRSMLSSMRLND